MPAGPPISCSAWTPSTAVTAAVVGKTSRSMPTRRRHGQRPRRSCQRLPSEYFRQSVYLTFQERPGGPAHAANMLNVDRLLWANDHPHSDATWPSFLLRRRQRVHGGGGDGRHLRRPGGPRRLGPDRARQLRRVVRVGGVTASDGVGAGRPGPRLRHGAPVQPEPARAALSSTPPCSGWGASSAAPPGSPPPWRTPGSGTGNPLPTIGLIAHHAAAARPLLAVGRGAGARGAALGPTVRVGGAAHGVALRVAVRMAGEHEAYGIAAGAHPGRGGGGRSSDRTIPTGAGSTGSFCGRPTSCMPPPRCPK